MIEFFFDCSSPWTYLAWHNIQPLAKEFAAEIIVAADPGRRHLQHRQSQRLCAAGNAGAAEGALCEEGSRRLGALGRACDQDAADGVSGEQRQGDARLHLAGQQGHGAVRARGIRGLLGRRQGHFAGRRADRYLQERRHRSRRNSLPGSATRRSRISSRPTPKKWWRAAASVRRPSSSTRPTCISAMTACR